MVRTWQPLSLAVPACSLRRAQPSGSVRVNATLLHPLVTSSVLWDHRAYGAVRHVHSFFPYYNVTDARTACGKRVCSAVLGISHRPLDILQFLFEQHRSAFKTSQLEIGRLDGSK